MSTLFPDHAAGAAGGQTLLSRPRLDALLERGLSECQALAVIAGAGYGKTQAVYDYLRRRPFTTVWIQLAERDNLEMRFWENLAGAFQRFETGLAAAMRRDGFPATVTENEIFQQRLRDALSPERQYVLVFDDFHLLRSESVQRFLVLNVNAFLNIKMVFITRARSSIRQEMPLERIAYVTASELCFTESEVALLLEKISAPHSRSLVAAIYRDTGGWAFAVNLVALSLKTTGIYESYARSAMRRRIFALLEKEIFDKFSRQNQESLLKISLLSQAPVELARAIVGDDVTLLESSVSFIHYDAYLDSFHIHQLFQEFLQERQDRLSPAATKETLLAAARWSEEHGQKIDAISYYEKAGDYDAVINVARGWTMQVPEDSANFVLNVLDAAPPGTVEKNVLYYVLHCRLLMSGRRTQEALAECDRHIRHFSALPPSPFNNQVLAGAYEAVAITGFVTAPETDRYDFDQPMARADYYYSLSPYEIKGQPAKMAVGPWASMVGSTRPGAHEEYIAALTRAAPRAANAMGGCMSGLDDLARGELFFYKADFKKAAPFLELARHKAGDHGQDEVVNRALFYLLRLAAAKGDAAGCAASLQKLEKQLEVEEYLTRHATYDIVTAWYYILVGRRRGVAEWLRGDLTESGMTSFLTEFANQIRVKLYHAEERYYDLLAFLARESESESGVLFGRLERKVTQAVCLYQTRDQAGALAALAEAYALARGDGFDLPFIEMGKDMRTLTAAALKSGSSDLPPQWLEKINKKSTTYAKRQLAVAEAFRRQHRLDDEVALSSRERDVLIDMYHGLSRAESAAHLNLSVNTVKSLLNMVYIKLGAETTAEALRAALERKLI
ncbi:MAG: LuxR C-terminal-related transcriptional regulator [Gracilibacteraceae bacterium]|jgi:LuxR family maltose regulon positive regulatory protein|nr:LuxR C-terminal-related transcriptional regulator [Gracilibacteraceae bacterium]